MPNYDYICDSCDSEFETRQGYDELPLVKCPDCGEDALRRLIFAPYVSILGEPKTLEHQAYRNSKKFSEDYKHHLDPQGYEERQKREKERSYEPWWGNPPKKLLNATPEKTKKYIETGEI